MKIHRKEGDKIECIQNWEKNFLMSEIMIEAFGGMGHCALYPMDDADLAKLIILTEKACREIVQSEEHPGKKLFSYYGNPIDDDEIVSAKKGIKNIKKQMIENKDNFDIEYFIEVS